MLLAYEPGAELIVAVGTHATMVEFLDKGRRGMASTFLTRLRLGPDARRRQGREPPLPGPGPAPRHRCSSSARPSLAMVVVAIVAEPIHVFMRGFWVTMKDIFGS